MKNDKEKSSNRFNFYLAILLVVLFAINFLRGCGSEEGSSDTDRAAHELGGRITESIEGNQKLQDQLGDAERTTEQLTDSLDRSEAAVGEAQGTVGDLESNLETAADAVAKCQRIIRDIKQRNEEGTQEP